MTDFSSIRTLFHHEDVATCSPLFTSPGCIIESVDASYDEDYDIVTLNKVILAFIDEKVKHSKDSRLSEMKSRYIDETTEMVKEYMRLNIKLSPSHFGDSVKKDKRVKQNKLILIETFITVASKYMPLNIIRIRKADRCLTCGKKLRKDKKDYCSGACLCEAEGESVVMSKRKAKESSYQCDVEKRNNFIKFMRMIQGNGDEMYIPLATYDALDDYLHCRYLRGREARLLPLDEYGGKEGTSHAIMYEALKQLGFTGYNEDISIICADMWGWKLPYYSANMDAILECLDKIYQALFRIKDEGRKATMSNHFVLLWILRHLQIKCRSDDFKIVDTPETLDRYEVLKREISDVIGWEDVSLS